MPLRNTTEQFIKQAIIKKENAYDYSKVEYVNSKTSIIIFCKSCNKEFKQTPGVHLSGKGGCTCMLKKTRTAQIAKAFVAKAVNKHGSIYDYTKVVYVAKDIKVIITCNSCGQDFQQTPHAHLSKCRCKWCYAASRKMTQETFLQKVANLYDKIDYSQVQYIDYTTHVQLRCTLHNCFYKQTPKKHIQQRGCPMCHTGMFSQYACRWIEFKAAWDNTNIQHALNGGEVYIEGVGKVDGFSAEKHKVYEFHGEFAIMSSSL